MRWRHRLLHRGQLEEQLEKELRFHVEQHAADLVARGVDPAEARRQARLALGGPEQVKESCRDARGTRWLEDLWQDFRYAVRTLGQKPGFTTVTLCTLALGIGATTVMFTVTDGVLLKPLPYADPEKLLAVHGRSAIWNAAAFGEQNVAYLDFLDLKRATRSLAMAGWLYSGGTVSEPGNAAYVEWREVSPELFALLGVPLLAGRTFLPEEDRLGAAPVAILGYSFWQQRFAGSTAAIGQSVVLDGMRRTVVGIARAAFRLDGDEPDLYTPLGQNPGRFLQNRRAHPVGVLARLLPGVTIAQAQAELSAMAGRLAAQYRDTNADRGFDARILRPDVQDVAGTLWLLLGAVTIVLLIACANVASLLLSRALSRERELAMRTALGASRGRLVRQCLTESAVLGLSGGVLGVALAALGIRPFVVLWPGALPRAEEVRLDWRVLAFALAVSLLSGVVFGLAPALRVPTRHLEQALRSGSRTLAGSSRRLHGAFVVSEIALAVVLLVSAGLLGRTLVRLSSLDPGINIRNVLVARTALAPATLASPARIRIAWDEILERARRVPGADAVTLVDTVPMRPGNNQNGYWTNAAVPPENRQPMALSTCVTPDYLKVVGLPLHEGRFFDERDRMGSEPVIVIDDVLAKDAFGRDEAVGKRLWIPDMGSAPLKVVGVVGHVRYWGLAGDDQARVRAQYYYPFAQVPDAWLRRWSELMSIAVRTTVPPLSLVEPLRVSVRGAANDQVLYEVRTLEQLARSSVARQRFLLLLFAVFGGLALMLACIGIYGVLAYLTARRVPEIGVRMALGASGSDVIRLVLRQSASMIVIGVGVGLCAALAAGKILQRLVEGMQSGGVGTSVGMVAVLVAAALLASFVPARRASRVDPVRALREE
ncbi:MAG TPA: ABC transporter permease [Candidatus Acidoferrales bacterium]|nr:ABC transporter permease [Candidatus Acidoferrales bacterium]